MTSTFGEYALSSVLQKFVIYLTLLRRQLLFTVCYGLGITVTPSNSKDHKAHKEERLYLHEEKQGKYIHLTGRIRNFIIYTNWRLAEYSNYSNTNVHSPKHKI